MEALGEIINKSYQDVVSAVNSIDVDAADSSNTELCRTLRADLVSRALSERQRALDTRGSLGAMLIQLTKDVSNFDKDNKQNDFIIDSQTTKKMKNILWSINRDIGLSISNWNNGLATAVSLSRKNFKRESRQHITTHTADEHSADDKGAATNIDSVNGHNDTHSTGPGLSDFADGETRDETEYAKSSREDISDKVTTLLNRMSLLLPSSSFVARQVPSPFSEAEHHTLPQGSVAISIYEDEPSSIIAYALAKHKYIDFVSAHGTKEGGDKAGSSASTAEKSELVGKQRDVGVGLGNSATASLPAKKESTTNQLLSALVKLDNPKAGQPKPTDAESPHFKYSFTDNTTKFYCQIFFAKEFHELRQQLHGKGAAGEESYMMSLARCVKWEPHGGKSKSEFCKMADNRFILKQMSRAEANSVVDFMPHYIEYMLDSSASKIPTVLAKVLGIYRIGFKNSVTGRAMKQDVLVMENLHCKRQILQTFDLKGSMRSRCEILIRCPFFVQFLIDYVLCTYCFRYS